jgi:GNAT superfamily N-acetyltransferase
MAPPEDESRTDLDIRVRPATADRWPDLVDLFQRPGPRGGKSVASGCWCMFWRRDRKEFWAGWGRGERRGEGNRAELKQLVRSAEPPGLLAYDDEQAIGWLALAPREDYPLLDRHRNLPRVDDRSVWSISCFYIHWAHHGQGVGEALVAGAVDYALGRGIEVLEAYPSRPGDDDPFTGYDPFFASNGFEKVFDDGGRRTIWRRSVATAAETPRR